MTEREDIEELAAEYALGSLSASERASVEARRPSEPGLDRAILAWERRLSPFSETLEPVAPSPGLYGKIRARIAPAAEVVSLQAYQEKLAARAARWRTTAIGMTAVAASLAGVMVWKEAYKPPMSATYVAVLQSGEQQPAFLMTIDTKSHMCAIKAVGAKKEQGKSYQLWMLHDTMPKPKDMGLIAVGDDMDLMEMAPDTDMNVYMTAKFAVSLEPEGGSPTGEPTGPVMYVGQLVQSMPDGTTSL